MMLNGNEGVNKDPNKACILVEPGVAKGCNDCQGVLAKYYHDVGIELSYADLKMRCRDFKKKVKL
jgi:hypothetical protein